MSACVLRDACDPADRMRPRLARSPQAARHGQSNRRRIVACRRNFPFSISAPCARGAPGALEALAAELRAAFTEYGFYFVRNHGVPEGLLAETFAAAERFHAMPLQRKLALKIDEHNIGYLPMRGATTRMNSLGEHRPTQRQRSGVLQARAGARPSGRRCGGCASAAATSGRRTCPASARRSWRLCRLRGARPVAAADLRAALGQPHDYFAPTSASRCTRSACRTTRSRSRPRRRTSTASRRMRTPAS